MTHNEVRVKSTTPITTLFLDVGGVLLTNGWGHQSRALAANTFHLNLEELEDRHHLTFDTYEVGKLTLEEYLGRTVFYEERPFTRDRFREFIVRADATISRDDRVGPPSRDAARTEDRHGQPALETWQGNEAHVTAAQQALVHRARCNRAARRGQYNAAMERT